MEGIDHGFQRRVCGALLTLAALAAPSPLVASAPAGDEEARQRRRMVEAIEADVRATRREIGKGRLDRRVMEAMATVPRHEFVPERARHNAYENRPLPIGHGQTISQPYIVALMTDLVEVKPGDKVLEVGTGSGYQAAVLAQLGAEVYSVEIVPQLAAAARQALDLAGYGGVKTRVGDGYYGWEEHAPFDGIVVTATAGQIPPPLIRQLRPGGRMVIPVGSPFATQQLTLVTKTEEGGVRTRQLLPVLFVPLTGEH